MRRLGVLATLAVAASCSDSGEPGGGLPAVIEAVGPVDFPGTPLDTVQAQLTVRVTDLQQRPVSGVSVTWSTPDGGGLLPPTSNTDGDGIARSSWVLGWRPGRQEARASVAGAQSAATFSATAAGFQASVLSLGDGEHQCATDNAGKLFCWGPNGNGELGDGTSTSTERPVPAQFTDPVAQIVTGFSSHGGAFTCALTTDAEVYCWGANDNGQLGNGSLVPSLSPSRVSLPAGRYRALTAIGGGACAIADGSGEGFCWGENRGGRFGSASSESPVLTPAIVLGGFPWQQLALGDDRACGIREGGQVYCWGSNPDWLGTGVETDTLSPHPVTNAPLMESVTLSGWHQCGITAAAITYCWGANRNIGIEDPRDVIPDPLALDPPSPFTRVHSIYKPTFALGQDKKAYWWGPSPLATGGGPLTPQTLNGEIPFKTLGTNGSGVCGAEEATGTVYCWSEFGFDGPERFIAIALP